MNPAVIVFDECDTLYEEGKTQYVTNILKTFFTRDPQRASEAFIECNKRRQFIFAGSSMNNEVIDTFKKIFPGIIDLKSETFGRISPFVEHQNIYIENNVSNDVEILVNLVRDQVMPDLIKDSEENEQQVNRSVMIFCNTQANVKLICEELGRANILNLPFNESKQISLKMRYRTLNLLHQGKVPVLVSDNLGSRGLDTMNVSHVIQFEYAKSAQEYL